MIKNSRKLTIENKFKRLYTIKKIDFKKGFKFLDSFFYQQIVTTINFKIIYINPSIKIISKFIVVSKSITDNIISSIKFVSKIIIDKISYF